MELQYIYYKDGIVLEFNEDDLLTYGDISRSFIPLETIEA